MKKIVIVAPEYMPEDECLEKGLQAEKWILYEDGAEKRKGMDALALLRWAEKHYDLKKTEIWYWD